MTVLDRHPSVGTEDALRQIEGGMGGAGLKEYGASPFVMLVQASFPDAFWPGVFYSWLSLKGHVQSYHNLEGCEMFATRRDGEVYALFMIIFALSEALVEFAATGYTVDRMLLSLGVDQEDINVQYLRAF